MTDLGTPTKENMYTVKFASVLLLRSVAWYYMIVKYVWDLLALTLIHMFSLISSLHLSQLQIPWIQTRQTHQTQQWRFAWAVLRAARRLRSLHFVPGGSQKFLDKALASRADALIIDLEDSVFAGREAASKSRCGQMDGFDTVGWQDCVCSDQSLGHPAVGGRCGNDHESWQAWYVGRSKGV